MHECFWCGECNVVWDCDYDFEDFGYEGCGIVQVSHCANCGAYYECYIEFKNDEDDTDNDKGEEN